MVQPCCGMSLQKATRTIAIIDIIICVICATIRLIWFDIQEYPDFDESSTLQTLDAFETSRYNVTASINQIDERQGSLGKENSVGKVTQYTKGRLALGSTTPNPVGSSSTVIPTVTARNLKQESLLAHFIPMAIISFVIYIGYVAIEIWLYRLLLSASSNRDSFVCKRWFWLRLTLTVFSLIFSIFGMVTLRYAWIEWILEPVTFYRAYELFIVNEFRKEIVATTGIVRPRTT